MNHGVLLAIAAKKRHNQKVCKACSLLSRLGVPNLWYAYH